VVQVASDPIIHAQSPSPLRHPRSAQADHAPSPFESLLDDSAPAADRPAPPPTDDKTSRADGSQPVRTSANSHDSKAPPAHDDDIAIKPQDDANVDEIQSEESAVECKVGANAKVIHCASASDDGKSTEDGKRAENKESDNLVPASPVENVGTNIKVDAIAAVPTPAPEPDQRQVPQLPEQAAPAAQLATQLKPLDPELLKDVVGKPAKVEKQGEPDKKASADEGLETAQTSDQPVDTPEATLQASPAARAQANRNMRQRTATASTSPRLAVSNPSVITLMVTRRRLPPTSLFLNGAPSTTRRLSWLPHRCMRHPTQPDPPRSSHNPIRRRRQFRSPDLRSKSRARLSPARTGLKSASIRLNSGA